MLRANPLSRRPDHKEGVNRDNKGQTLLKLEFFAIKAISCKHTSLLRLYPQHTTKHYTKTYCCHVRGGSVNSDEGGRGTQVAGKV
jgi:hypothetical protein